MKLERYEELTGKVIAPDAQRVRVTELLSVAESFINTDCGGRFLVADGLGGVKIDLPPDVEMGVVLLLKAFDSDPTVASISLAGMSKSFVQGGAYAAASAYWRNYKRIRFC